MIDDRLAPTLHRRVEEFLFGEAELLDDWKLDAWLALFTEDGMNAIPPLQDPGLDPGHSTYLLHDDSARRRLRVKHLLSGDALAESPPAKSCRLITNVRIVESGESAVRTRSNFFVQRSRRGEITSFAGSYRHRLVVAGDSFRIAERLVILAQDIVHQGQISFIL